MRATTLIVFFALASYASAAIVDCSTVSPVPANGAKCTDVAITVQGNSIAAKSAVTCVTGYYIALTNAGTATSCVAVGNGCTVNAATKAGTGATDPTTPTSNTCVKAYPVPTAADGSDSFIASTAAATDVMCANPAGADATKTYYTAGALATAAGVPFTATPINTWKCLACPAGCVDCTPTTGNTASPAAATQTGCKTAGTGFYINSASTANSAGLMAIATCPTTTSATYGSTNASACSACMSTTNCTAATCTTTGLTYISVANTTGYKSGNTDLTSLPASYGPLQGCFNVTALIAQFAPNTSTNGSNSTNTSNTTTSATRINLGVAAVVTVAAAVFAF